MFEYHNVCRPQGRKPGKRSELASDVIVRCAAVGVGTVLLWYGTRKAGLIGAVSSLAGMSFCMGGISGRWLPSFLPSAAMNGPQTPVNAPSYADDGKPAPQVPLDEVEEASMESFPASDPPASRHTTAPPDAANSPK